MTTTNESSSLIERAARLAERQHTDPTARAELTKLMLDRWNDAKDILDHATRRRRELSADEQRKYDRAIEDFTHLQDLSCEQPSTRRTVEELEESRREFDRIARPGIRGNDPGRSLGDRLAHAVAAVRDGSVATANVELRAITEAGAGGALVPFQVGDPEHTLRAAAVVFRIPGIRVVQMATDRLRLPRLAAATAATTAEAATIATSDADIDAVDLLTTKVAVFSSVSTELVEDAPADALTLLGENLLEALARELDDQMLSGTGSGGDLVGLRNISGVSTTSVAATPASMDKFVDTIYAAKNANAVPSCWVLHPRSWSTLAKVKTGITSDNTTLLQPDPQQSAQRLLGLDVIESTQITVAEGATSVGSWVAAVDGRQLVIGERRPARFEISKDLLFDSDRIAIRATGRWGFAAVNPEGISIATDVRA